MEYSEYIEFDLYGSTVIVDNYEKPHIYSEEYMFTYKIYPIIYNEAENIGGKDLIPKGIDAVI